MTETDTYYWLRNEARDGLDKARLLLSKELSTGYQNIAKSETRPEIAKSTIEAWDFYARTLAQLIFDHKEVLPLETIVEDYAYVTRAIAKQTRGYRRACKEEFRAAKKKNGLVETHYEKIAVYLSPLFDAACLVESDAIALLSPIVEGVQSEIVLPVIQETPLQTEIALPVIHQAQPQKSANLTNDLSSLALVLKNGPQTTKQQKDVIRPYYDEVMKKGADERREALAKLLLLDLNASVKLLLWRKKTHAVVECANADPISRRKILDQIGEDLSKSDVSRMERDHLRDANLSIEHPRLSRFFKSLDIPPPPTSPEIKRQVWLPIMLRCRNYISPS